MFLSTVRIQPVFYPSRIKGNPPISFVGWKRLKITAPQSTTLKTSHYCDPQGSSFQIAAASVGTYSASELVPVQEKGPDKGVGRWHVTH